MDTYFEELNELIGAAKADIEAGRYGISAAIKPEIAIAMYGDMDAVFSSFKREIGASYRHSEPKKLEKLYKKLDKKIAKMKKAKYVYEAQKCFSSDERMAPCVSYEFAMYYLCNDGSEYYISNMETAAVGGDPRAITYCQNYYSTNSEEANPYAGASYAQNIKLNGKFDFNKMFYYAILGIGFDYSPYYPDRYTVIPNTFSGADVEGKRKEALEKLYETLAYFVLPENMESEDYQKHFGDFVPSELQVKIARKWFFVEDDRFVMPNGMHRYLAEMREKITEAIHSKAAPKKKKETAKPKTTKTEDKKSEQKKASTPAETQKEPKLETITLKFDNGDSYEGQSLNGQYHGMGTYRWANGDVYIGEFCDDASNGKGKYLYANGNIYEGDFCNWSRHGNGRFTYSQSGDYAGDYYEGSYVNGQRTGKGTYVSAKGWRYEGDWIDGRMEGKGKYVSDEGWYYEGDFVNGVSEGYGVHHYANGDVFEGEWKNDKRQGKGKYTFADGSYYTGEWKDGKNISASETVRPATKETKAAESKKTTEKKTTGTTTAHQSYSSGDTYDGEMLNGKRHGHGIYRWADGDCYEGDFVNNKRTGYGRYEHYTDKWQTKHFCDLVYEGQWKDGEKHGKGVEKHYMPGVNEDVTVYEGEWVNGKREGIFVWYLFYPATGKQSSKDMEYYRDGKCVMDGVPYDASIKTYEDFAAAKAKLDAATEERKCREAASASPATAKESVSSVSTLDDDIVTEWEKIDGPGDLLEMWKNPQSFTVDTDDWMITHSCEYFDHYFYTPLDSNNITTCCEEGDCAGANEILAELLGIPESVLGSAITEYREKLYGPQAYRYGYSVGEVIHSAILAAVQYGCHPAGIMNIAMYMYLHFDNTDELFLDALKCYEHGWGVDGCNDEEGIASLWFRRYMYHNGDMVEDLYDVEEHNHGEYENRWYIHINAELFEQGKTMLSNGFLGLPAYMLDSTTEENDYDEDDYSISELFHEHFYTSGEYHVSEERLSDGRICTGRLTADGNPEGECVLTDSAGNEYVCKYHNGSFHGDVYFTYANGDKFTGYYCHGKKTGVGEMVWADGERRLCIYKNDKPNGIGIYFPNYGKVRPCIYVNGEDTYKKDMEKRLRKAEYHTFEDSRYEGNVKIARDGEIILHGYGTLYFDNGSIYSGLFQNDKFCEGFIYRKEVNVLMYGTYDIDEAPHGKVTILFGGDLEMYEGDFDHGNYHGKGKYQDISGITYLVRWENSSPLEILEVYDFDGSLIPRSKAPFLYKKERLRYHRILM